MLVRLNATANVPLNIKQVSLAAERSLSSPHGNGLMRWSWQMCLENQYEACWLVNIVERSATKEPHFVLMATKVEVGVEPEPDCKCASKNPKRGSLAAECTICWPCDNRVGVEPEPDCKCASKNPKLGSGVDVSETERYCECLLKPQTRFFSCWTRTMLTMWQ